MRFDDHADDRESAARYLYERAHQLLIDGFLPAGTVEPLHVDGYEIGAQLAIRSPEQRPLRGVVVYASQRDRAVAALAGEPPIVTTPGGLEPLLVEHAIPHVVASRIIESREYRAIEAEYGDRIAERSRVPLIRHIDEGLAVLARIGASAQAQRAFCIHPLLQEDAALVTHVHRLGELTDDPCVLAFALEYRHIANTTRSTRPISSADDIPLSPLAEVNQMLVADKVQNRKDFILHHRATHPRRDELDRYFRLWLERLHVSDTHFAELFEQLQVTATPISLADALARSGGAAQLSRR